MIETPARTPDFFIIGAPKCGTTALDRYLSEHPQICMPDRKDQNYFCVDFPNLPGDRTKEAYDRVFSRFDTDKIVGESSVWYLYSREAVSRILHVRPDAKFIVMLRNPVDAAISLHGHNQTGLRENTPTIEEAWKLQTQRAQGRRLPRNMREPALFQYGKVYSYANQLERLFDATGPSQRLVIIFEEFFADPERAYPQVLQFLGVAPDGRKDFRPVNSAHQSRSALLTSLAYPAESTVARFEVLRRLSHALGFHPLRALKAISKRPVKSKRTVSAAMREEMVAFFEADIARVEALLGRNLPIWRPDGTLGA